MISAVENYLAVRRAAGFALSNTEYLLRSFAAFAASRREVHVRTATAIRWASECVSVAQRHTRYQTICRFAQYVRLEEPRHESPPPSYFAHRKARRIPRIYSHVEIEHLILAARQLPPQDSLCPHTYATVIGLLCRDGFTDLGSVGPANLRPHAQRLAGPQDQISEDSPGTVA